jgi:hypothetical protein
MPVDPMFFYSLLFNSVLLIPLFGLLPTAIGVIASKATARADIFTYRRKLTTFVLLFLASSVVGFGVSMVFTDPNLRLGAVSLFTLLIPAIAYGFLANSSAKRLVDMGRSKFLALALAIPLVNFGVIAWLAFSFASRPSET